jgi:Ran GTPase-activating protein (RanGAP) involved in mRNA processing and transport
LYCDANVIGEEGCEKLAECMEMMDSLKKVCIENNNIGDRGAIALSKALEDNDTLLSLHLENNNISREGAYTLGEMISNKYKLSKLNLNLNPIGDEGFSRIARGIQDIETLRIITLAQTNITHLSMPILSQSLANKRFLTKLLLDNNKIGQVGA